MKNKLILSCLVAVLGAFSANAAPKFQNIHLIPGNEAIGGKVTVIKNSQRWTADTVYICDRLTFVEAPAVLTIEPGTIVRMEQKTTGGTSVTDPADVGTLIICRGAKIVANGTAESPIIFTNIDDPFVPGGEITIPNKHNGVTDNSTYAPYDTANSANNNYTKNIYTGNSRFNYDATCGGLMVLGRTPVAFGNPGSSGNISVQVTAQGEGYVAAPSVSFLPTGAVGTASLESTGRINGVTLSNRGVYNVSSPVTVSFTAGSGSSVTTVATATVSMREISGNPGKYELSDVTMVQKGFGYASATVVFSGLPTGGDVVTAAAATATIGKKVAQIILSNPGGAYGAAPAVTIGAAPAGGSNAAATAALAGAYADPTAIPSATTGVGANFIEGLQTIDGALLGSAVNYSGSIYGGSDDNDNSGTLRFISIRYGGFVLSTGNEINGLTCGAVGRGTLFEFIEVVNNADDGIEHFGGSVDMKYVADLFGGDDGIDIDQGYRGRIQFAFQIQNNTSGTSRNSQNIGDKLGEWDGGEAPNTSRPYTVHTLFNFTGIGAGTTSGTGGVNYKDNSGGKVFNSIFADCKIGITLESAAASIGDNVTGNNSGSRFGFTRTDGGVENILGVDGSAGEPDAMIKYTSWRAIGASTDFANTTTFANLNRTVGVNWVSNLGTAGNNDFVNNISDFRSIARVSTAGGLDPRLTANSTIRNNGIRPDASGGVRQAAGVLGQAGYRAADTFYTQTQLRGAFRDLNWLSGWSLASEWGLLSDANVAIPAVKLTRASGILTVSFTPTSGVEYVIETSPDGKKFTPFKTVTAGATDVSEALGAGTANALLFVRVMPL